MWGRIFVVGVALAANVQASKGADALPAGIWISESYGYVFEVDNSTAQIYDISVAGCVVAQKMSKNAAAALLGAATVSPDGQSATLFRTPTRDTVTKTAALPSSCVKPLKTTDPIVNLDVFLKTFAGHYAFFKARKADWAALSENARRRVAAGDDLFAVISDLIRALDDGHVSLEAGERRFEIDRIIAPGTAPEGGQWTWKALRTDLRAHVQGPKSFLSSPAALTANRRILAGRTPDGYGYIAVLSMGGWKDGQTEDAPSSEHVSVADAELDALLNDLGDVKGMIVDLRVNSGGFDSVALTMVGRFAARQSIAYLKSVKGPDGTTTPYPVAVKPSERKRYDGPVAVLVGPNTVSAGEAAALGFKSLANARLFGRPTRGILSDAIPKYLPNGWAYTLSTEITTLADGTLVEVAGVKPDVVVDPPQSLDWNSDVRAALSWLKEGAK